MFFVCFTESPQIPATWDLRHLWRIQSLVAGLLFSELDGYRKLQTPGEFLDVLLCDLEEVHLAAMSQQNAIDRKLEHEVRVGERQYLKTESRCLFQFCKTETAADLRPLGERIVRWAKDNPEFADFLKKSAQPPGIQPLR